MTNSRAECSLEMMDLNRRPFDLVWLELDVYICTQFQSKLAKSCSKKSSSFFLKRALDQLKSSRLTASKKNRIGRDELSNRSLETQMLQIFKFQVNESWYF